MKIENEWIYFYEWFKAEKSNPSSQEPQEFTEVMSTLYINIIEREEQPESPKEPTEEEIPEKPKRSQEAHKWELAKGGETFTVTYFPSLKPIFLTREEDKEDPLIASNLTGTKRDIK